MCLGCHVAFSPKLHASQLQVCGDLWAKSIPKSRLPDLQLATLEAICCMELHLPASEADIKLHDLLHLAFDVIPAYGK